MNLFTLIEDRPFVSSVIEHFFLFMLLYVMIRISVVLINKGRFAKNEFRYFVGMLYFSFVLAITFTPVDFTTDWGSIISRIQLIPFDTVTRYWPLDGDYSLYNIIGNVILMIPILPILTTNFGIGTFGNAIRFTVVFILFIEIGQLFFTTTRVFDVDDFILNMLGFFISALLWQIMKKVKVVS